MSAFAIGGHTVEEEAEGAPALSCTADRRSATIKTAAPAMLVPQEATSTLSVPAFRGVARGRGALGGETDRSVVI